MYFFNLILLSVVHVLSCRFLVQNLCDRKFGIQTLFVLEALQVLDQAIADSRHRGAEPSQHIVALAVVHDP